MTGGATFSTCQQYRYTLTREWGEGGLTVNYVALNPSTATAEESDPTITRLVRRSIRLNRGFTRLVVTNIFAWRSTDPNNLLKVEDAVGPDNDEVLQVTARSADLVVCGWSGHRAARWRGPAVKALLQNTGAKLHVLKLNDDGSPCHPLYLKYELEPFEWN